MFKSCDTGVDVIYVIILSYVDVHIHMIYPLYCTNCSLDVAQSLFSLTATGPKTLTVSDYEQFVHAQKSYFRNMFRINFMLINFVFWDEI